MLTKRIIPCLDIKEGRTVKGINFKNLVDAGDPVELASYYSDQGADELVFLDISATAEKRKTFAALVRKIAQKINIPFTVGGGIASVAEARTLLLAGADKISINSAAIRNPTLIKELSEAFGGQCVVVAIDAKKVDDTWRVYSVGGAKPTSLNLFTWAKEVVKLGAGEILFTSMDNDGTKQGFANKALLQLSKTVNVPIIASGGAGEIAHFTETFRTSGADAALAASVFHFNQITIPQLKKELHTQGIAIRKTP